VFTLLWLSGSADCLRASALSSSERVAMATTGWTKDALNERFSNSRVREMMMRLANQCWCFDANLLSSSPRNRTSVRGKTSARDILRLPFHTSHPCKAGHDCAPCKAPNTSLLSDLYIIALSMKDRNFMQMCHSSIWNPSNDHDTNRSYGCDHCTKASCPVCIDTLCSSCLIASLISAFSY
jgi:hypothetical protein